MHLHSNFNTDFPSCLICAERVPNATLMREMICCEKQMCTSCADHIGRKAIPRCPFCNSTQHVMYVSSVLATAKDFVEHAGSVAFGLDRDVVFEPVDRAYMQHVCRIRQSSNRDGRRERLALANFLRRKMKSNPSVESMAKAAGLILFSESGGEKYVYDGHSDLKTYCETYRSGERFSRRFYARGGRF